MKIDLGFWNEQGEYVPDIQDLEIAEIKLEKIKDACKYLKAMNEDYISIDEILEIIGE